MNKIKISIAFDANIISHAESTPRESDTDDMEMLKSTSTELLKDLRELVQSTQGLRLVISDTAFDEISDGNAEKAKNRIKLTQDMEILKDVPEIEKLAGLFMDEGVFRPKAGNDAMILANAVFYGMDYLVTWNMKDLANERNKRDIKRIIQPLSYDLPRLCTGDDFLDDYIELIGRRLNEHQVGDKGMLYNIDTMTSTKAMKSTETAKPKYRLLDGKPWDKKSKKEKREWIEVVESSEVMIESRRWRAKKDEERRKDPKKYWEDREALRKKWKAQGVKFAPVPPTPPWIKKLLKAHREKLAAREAAKKKTQEK
ncbi:MAG: type II toxin-antitoxin system VapC family toxin [Candidatus Portiera sp.]|nr:type II toxin-antitoxin system VapC family toxin [Portiera sp.]